MKTKAYQIYRLEDNRTEILGQFFDKKAAENLLRRYQTQSEGKYGIRLYVLPFHADKPLAGLRESGGK